MAFAISRSELLPFSRIIAAFGRGFEASITGFPVKCVEKYSLMLGFIIVKTRLCHSVLDCFLIKRSFKPNVSVLV
jgi:hypothetical protein